jgi:hypothetical protein
VLLYHLGFLLAVVPPRHGSTCICWLMYLPIKSYSGYKVATLL